MESSCLCRPGWAYNCGRFGFLYIDWRAVRAPAARRDETAPVESDAWYRHPGNPMGEHIDLEEGV